MNNKPTIAIIGAGASGLMCADYLAQYQVNIQIFEQMPSAGRKILWAGKTGLNISHAEVIDDFVQRYHPATWLSPYIREFDAVWLQQWAKDLGIETYIGSTGRIFPREMKASPLLRTWLKRLAEQGVQIFYRHKCVHVDDHHIQFENLNTQQQFTQKFDAIILACGGLSYPKLGSTGEWQQWLTAQDINPMYASNVGVCRTWSCFMQDYFGQALKRVRVYVGDAQHQYSSSHQGDIIITHYGLESGLIYKLNYELRAMLQHTGRMNLTVDLLPDIAHEKILQQWYKHKKMSLNTLWQKIGLDKTKIALLRECSAKADWHNADKMVISIKALNIEFQAFRPIEEAISSGGGVKQTAVNENFQLYEKPSIFCAGEMLDWDAPTGGYLLTACFATGRACGRGVAQYLALQKK